jgi:hypothetical protein
MANLCDDVVPGLRLGEVENELRLAEPGVVTVTVNEARDNEPTLQIDDAGLRPNPLLDLGVRPDGGDSVATNGDGLGSWMLRVDGEQVTVQKDEIGAALGVGRARGHHAKGGKQKVSLGHGPAPMEGGMNDTNDADGSDALPVSHG